MGGQGTDAVLAAPDGELGEAVGAGGPVADKVYEDPEIAKGKVRLVILIHGYNVNLNDGRGGYNEFGQRIGEQIGDIGGLPIDLFAGFYWPGDVDLRWFSCLSYPIAPRSAINSARRLQEFLLSLHGPGAGPIQVDIVAHSLGCRLIVECLSALSNYPGIRAAFTGTCLMAAAVPIDTREFRKKLKLTANMTRLLVLHSNGDEVLQLAFPLGQTLAGEGFFPKALGRFGPPPGLNAQGEAINSLNHGDYWSKPVVASRVASFLNLCALRRQISERETPTRSLGAERSTPER